MASIETKPAIVADFSEPQEQEWPENPTEMDCFGW
jgi:hypothetical protein